MLSYSPSPSQNGQTPVLAEAPKLDSSIEELLPTRVRHLAHKLNAHYQHVDLTITSNSVLQILLHLPLHGEDLSLLNEIGLTL